MNRAMSRWRAVAFMLAVVAATLFALGAPIGTYIFAGVFLVVVSLVVEAYL